jgi:hypothetical protein
MYDNIMMIVHIILKSSTLIKGKNGIALHTPKYSRGVDGGVESLER